ncbi:MAG: DEAD/DEAH box helicase [Spirochaetaceae bacterium]|jgi:superfamily II DNA/RNA helicase|nr:DEAD/DEAH box helicase [Spirochaetaceae bacterium]
MNAFTALGISSQLADALEVQHISDPTVVQKQVIPAVLAGDSVVFQSETGTGKTFAYLLPLLTRILTEGEGRLLVLAPTHELASQIKRETERVCDDGKTGLKSALFIGGAPLGRQIEKLKEKPAVLCGGPSRIMELMSLKKLKPAQITAVVLDEADRLFAPELRDTTAAVLKALNPGTQLVACSATIRPQLVKLLRQSGAGYQGLNTILLPPEDVLRLRISHWALYAERRDKTDTLRRFIAAENPERTLVFTSRVDAVMDITEKLRFKKISCCGLHAKTDKVSRKKAIDDFRSGRCSVLITSDLAARGLDIQGITHVVQLDLPEDSDFFVHRAGRTGRAGKTGINTVIGDETELRRLAGFEKKLGILVYPKELYGGKVLSPVEESEDGEEQDGSE